MKKILAISLLTLLAVSIYAASDNSQQLSVRQTFSQSADISLSQLAACWNIAISGQCQINHNGQTSLFRAILVDENGEEYLVAEFNDLISSEQQVSFNSRCDETAFSSSIKPAKLKIIIVNAQATIDNVTYDNNESATRGTDDIAAAKSARVANEIVEDVSASRTNYTVDIYNSNGLRMESTAVRNTDGVKQVNTSSYMDGYYTIRLLDNGTLIDSKNFIVKH